MDTFVLVAVTGQAHAQDRPNVVVMLADNVGYGDIGAYGGAEIRGMPTPHRSARQRRVATDAIPGGAGLHAIARSADDRALFTAGGSQHHHSRGLAGFIGAQVPTDRPIDGVDQGAFFTGKQEKSNRESLITLS